MATKLEKIERIAKQKMLNLLLNFKKEISATGVAFASAVYFVDESGSKTVNKQKVLQKFVRTNITIGSNYEGRINRDLVKQEEEANFTAQAMSGKEYVNNEGVIATDTKTKTKNYLVAVVENKTKPTTVYMHNGRKIEKDKAIELGLFMPSYFAEKKTAGRGNMQESTDIHIINLNIDNLISLKIGGKKYIIED